MNIKKFKLLFFTLLVITTAGCQLAGNEENHNSNIEKTFLENNLLCGFWIAPSHDGMETETFSPNASGIMMYTYFETK